MMPFIILSLLVISSFAAFGFWGGVFALLALLLLSGV